MQGVPLPSGSQFQNINGTVLFQAQEARRSLGITPLADQIPEPQQSFHVILTGVEG
jgi:hypothetical protein